MLSVLAEGRQESKSEYQICNPESLNYIVHDHNWSLVIVCSNDNNECKELKNDVAENFGIEWKDNQDTDSILPILPM